MTSAYEAGGSACFIVTPLWLAPAIQGLDDARMPQVFLHFVHSVQTSFNSEFFQLEELRSRRLADFCRFKE